MIVALIIAGIVAGVLLAALALAACVAWSLAGIAAELEQERITEARVRGLIRGDPGDNTRARNGQRDREWLGVGSVKGLGTHCGLEQ